MITEFKHGELESRILFARSRRFEGLGYLRDLIVSAFFPFSEKRRVDLYIGGNPLNALAGLVSRRLGLVRTVVFYKIDYVPRRFKNPIFNHVYQKIDNYCSRECDWTWNLSSIMIERRKERIGPERTGRQIVVPIGSNFERIERYPAEKVSRRRLVYMGTLRPNQGIELAIRAFPLVKRQFPDAELLIIGSGPLEHKLKSLVKEMKVKDVVFTGQIPDHRKVEEILSGCGIGLATYEPSQETYTAFTEPGKVKVYLACGLPVIITKVPQIASDIESRKMGVVIDYSIQDLVEGVTKLIDEEDTYFAARDAAIKFASEFSWSKIFDRAFETVLVRDLQK